MLNRSKYYRKVKQLEKELKKARAQVEKYRKRSIRLKPKVVKSTPKKVVEKLLKRSRVTHTVKRTLEFSTAIMCGIKRQYKESHSYKTKQAIARLVQGSVKKYRMYRMAAQVCGIPKKQVKKAHKITDYTRKKSQTLGQKLAKTVEAFLNRDDNSRITTGKHDTISKNKVKKQRRILADTLENLHAKFCQEKPAEKMSYSLFCRLRPFYIVHPKNKDRQSCLCRIHENARLIVEKMNQLKLLPAGVHSAEGWVKAAVCPKPSQACYDRKCQNCKENLTINPDDPNDTVSWQQWKTVKEARVSQRERRHYSENCTVNNWWYCRWPL